MRTSRGLGMWVLSALLGASTTAFGQGLVLPGAGPINLSAAG